MKFTLPLLAIAAACAIAAPIENIDQTNKVDWWKRGSDVEQTNKVAWWKRGKDVEQTNNTEWGKKDAIAELVDRTNKVAWW